MELFAPLGDVILDPLSRILNSVLNTIPGILWFLVITIVGYFIAVFVGFITRKILYRFNLDKQLRRMDLHDSLGNMSIAKLAAIIAKWYIFIIFLQQGVSFLNLGTISLFMNSFVNWLPKLIVSIIVIILGLLFIDFIVHKILEIKNKYIQTIGNLIKVILIIVVVFTAIEQLGIKTQLAQNIFLMMLGSILITFSLALGIGVGLSLKDEIKPYLKKLKKKMS